MDTSTFNITPSFCGVSVTNTATVACLGTNYSVPGDLNGDGIVDQSELNLVLMNYWTRSPWLYMTNAAKLCDGAFQFALTNTSGWNFTVLVSTNLSDWTNLRAEIADIVTAIRERRPAISPFQSLAISSSAAEMAATWAI